jgi:hypothetical protein
MESAAQAALSVFTEENATLLESRPCEPGVGGPTGTPRCGREFAMQTSDE